MITLFPDKNIVAYKFENLVATLEPQSIGTGACMAIVTVMGGTIRYRFDGGEPNTTLGHLAKDGEDILLLNSRHIEQFKFVSNSTSPTILSITYGRP